MATRNHEINQNKVNSFLINNAKRTEKQLIKLYRKALNQIRVLMVDLYEKLAVNGKLTLSEMSKFNRLKKLEKKITKEILNPMLTKSKAATEKLILADYQGSYYGYAWATDQAVGVNLDWTLLKEADIKNALNNPLKYIAFNDLSGTTKQGVNRAIAQGLSQGKGIAQMSKDIKKAMNISINKAIRIARTEVHRVVEMGHRQEFLESKKNGMDVKFILVSTLDDRTRPQSAQMDGQESNKDGLFKYPGVSEPKPVGDSGVAAYDINDRERTVERIEGFSPAIRRTREDGLIPAQTFKQWAQEKGLKKNIYGQILFPAV